MFNRTSTTIFDNEKLNYIKVCILHEFLLSCTYTENNFNLLINENKIIEIVRKIYKCIQLWIKCNYSPEDIPLYISLYTIEKTLQTFIKPLNTSNINIYLINHTKKRFLFPYKNLLENKVLIIIVI